MGDWPLSSHGQIGNAGFTVTTLTTTTASASTHTKGAYAQLSAAVPFSVHGVVIHVMGRSVNTDMLLDIAVGAAAAEQVVIANLLVTGNTSGAGGKNYYFPLRIPNGSRVAARIQSATASATAQVAITYYGTSFLGLQTFNKFVTYGAVTGSSTGTALGAPAGANTYGAWTQLTASTAEPLSWLMPVLGDNSIVTRTSAQKFVYTAGIGAAAAEVEITPPLVGTMTSQTLGLNTFVGLPTPIKSGTRIAGRYGSSAVTTLGATMCVYGGWG